MNKKYGVAVIIACAIIAGGVLAFTSSNNTGPTNSAGKSQQLNASNSITANSPTSTNGKHLFASVNETVTIKANP